MTHRRVIKKESKLIPITHAEDEVQTLYKISGLNRGHLYEFLRNYEGDLTQLFMRKRERVEWMENCIWLFSLLGVIPMFKRYDYCTGNFDQRKFSPATTQDFENFFLKSCNEGGDSADLVMKHKSKDKIIALSSKNHESIGPKTLDIEKIKAVSKLKYSVKVAIAIKDRKMIDKFIGTNSKDTIFVENLKEIKENNLIIDYEYLVSCFSKFKTVYKDISLDQLKSLGRSKKPLLTMRPHGEYTVLATTQIEANNILWGHICRSGKSYIMAAYIDLALVSQKRTSICLIITTAPNNTISQYLDVLYEHSNFANCNVMRLDANNCTNNQIMKDKCNIFIASKQFLQTEEGSEKHKIIPWLKTAKIDLRFIDETHNGGTTNLSKSTLDMYGKNAKTIFMTATYFKAVNSFDIEEKNSIIWSLDAIRLCKNFTPENREILYQKYGNICTKVFDKYSQSEIEELYSNFPHMHVETLSFKEKALAYMESSEEGFSVSSLMNPIENEFQGVIFDVEGTSKERMLVSVMKELEKKFDEIQNFCQKYDSRTYTKENNLIILCFIPGGTRGKEYVKMCEALKKFLEKHHVFDKFVINDVCGSEDALKVIKNTRKIAFNSQNKIGSLILAGDKLKEGVSLSYCDIVFMLNEGKDPWDAIQRYYRSGTESPGKKLCFVVDTNVGRRAKTIIEFSEQLFPDMSSKKGLKKFLCSNIMSLDLTRNWDKIFEFTATDEECIENIAKSILDSYAKHYPKDNLEKIKKSFFITKDDFTNQKDFFDINKMLIENKTSKTKPTETINSSALNGNGNNLHQPTSTAGAATETTVEPEPEPEVIVDEELKNKLSDYYHSFIILMIILTNDNDEFDVVRMFELINSNADTKKALLSHIRNNWKIISDDINQTEIILNHLVENMRKTRNKLLNSKLNKMSKKIKHEFRMIQNQPRQIAELIDDYLPSTDEEKKQWAEYGTKKSLRFEILKLMICPKDLRISVEKSKQIFDRLNCIDVKIFEPCCGKGGFILDIIDMLMEMPVFIHTYPNEKERYKQIVENNVYFADINDINIFICKMLLNRGSNLKLKYYCGDSLDPKFNVSVPYFNKTFNVSGFDFIVGNPPFNANGAKNNGSTIYQDFIQRSINDWMNPNGYLIFINPPAWRKPTSIQDSEKETLNTAVFKLFQNNNLIYLNILGFKGGKKHFGIEQQIDYYMLQKAPNDGQSIIHTYKDDETVFCNEINISDWSWLPNGNFQKVADLTSGKRFCKVLVGQNRYRTAAKGKKGEPEKPMPKIFLSRTKNDNFCYPVCAKISKENVEIIYSSECPEDYIKQPKLRSDPTPKPKVIFSEGGTNKAYIDENGECIMSDQVFGIEVDNLKDARDLFQLSNSEVFLKFIKENLFWSTQRFDYRLFSYLKYGFWKEFI